MAKMTRDGDADPERHGMGEGLVVAEEPLIHDALRRAFAPRTRRRAAVRRLPAAMTARPSAGSP